ncbi:MAG TPA: hypothetical protein VKZ42_00135, partial [Flavobacteriaceae bacterium]|nr:hypothetical protein [Flavobacteriaceae bacterium]
MKKWLYFLFLLTLSGVSGQQFTRQDTLRGSITPQRSGWDLQYYHLDIEVNPEEKYISGKNTIRYKVVSPFREMQIDLQEPMQIDKVIHNGKELSFRREGSAYFISFKKKQQKNKEAEITVYYSGHPHIAKNAPWDGGIVFTQDQNGNPF